jgi:hypothetical protein
MILSHNSATANKDNIVVYVCSPKGELELVPDGRLTQAQLNRIGYKGWRRCEAVGAREIEKVSLILSRQLFEKRKMMKVGQALREMEIVKQGQISARIRRAQNFSKADAELNAQLEKRWALREAAALSVIASEFNPEKRTTALQMELRPRSTSKVANIGQKKEGLA